MNRGMNPVYPVDGNGTHAVQGSARLGAEAAAINTRSWQSIGRKNLIQIHPFELDVRGEIYSKRPFAFYHLPPLPGMTFCWITLGTSSLGSRQSTAAGSVTPSALTGSK